MDPVYDTHPRAAEVRAFWFGQGAQHGTFRDEWFQKSVPFDDGIRAYFLPLYEAAAAGKLASWKLNASDCLALALVLDQFPRNMFRGRARAFEADSLARETARHALRMSYDETLLPVERLFIYLPFEHSELMADQDLCVRLMKQLDAFPETKGMYVWAEKHRAIVERFGRFPHRNRALGRRSTQEELAFLKEPGSGF